jgi:excisionase family DNA binding protein
MLDANENHLTTSQAGRALGISKTRVLQLADDGRLPHVRTPLGRLFDPEAVRALALERQRNGHQVAEAV